MKTTTKEFKNKVRAHIIENLGNPWNEDTQSENENATTAERLQNVVNCFNDFYCPYEKHRTPNRQEAFKDFLQGLPNCLHTEFTYYGQRETLRQWFEQTEEQADKYSFDEIENRYYWLVFREFSALCRVNKIAF